MPVVGLPGSGWAESAAYTRAAVRTGLSDAGYVENRNVMFEYRYAEGKFERLPQLAAELAQRGVSVIIAPHNPRTFDAKFHAMAGFGTGGPRPRSGKRHTAEDLCETYPRLDVFQLHRAQALYPGARSA